MNIDSWIVCAHNFSIDPSVLLYSNLRIGFMSLYSGRDFLVGFIFLVALWLILTC